LLADAERDAKRAAEPILFAVLADQFLDWVKREKAENTYIFYQYHLQGFCSFRKTRKVDEVTPQDIEDWFSSGKRKLGKGTRSRAIEAISRVFNWGIKQKIIRENPLLGMDRPEKPRREIYITPEQRQIVLSAYPEGDPFRDFLFSMEQTGCRPGEVSLLTSENVFLEQGVWVTYKHKTRGQTKGKPRIVYLSEAMVQLTKKLLPTVPAGTPLFRNSEGEPWNRNSIRLRLRRVRKRLKIPGLVAYLYRHGFVTQALEKGLSDALVAQLVGHANTAMIHKHYSFLSQNAKLLREAANKAVQ
jgi:integrase